MESESQIPKLWTLRVRAGSMEPIHGSKAGGKPKQFLEQLELKTALAQMAGIVEDTNPQLKVQVDGGFIPSAWVGKPGDAGSLLTGPVHMQRK